MLYPLLLTPSPPPSLPLPPCSRASLPLASPPLQPESHTPEALEQSRPTRGNRYSHHHSLFLSASICLTLAQCLHGQHVPLINGGRERAGDEGVCLCSPFLPVTFALRFHHSPFPLLASLFSITLSHSSCIKVSLSECGIFSRASRTRPFTLVLFLSAHPIPRPPQPPAPCPRVRQPWL